MKAYPSVQDLLQPVLRVAMPRAMWVYASGSTVHVMARCNNREFWSSCAAYALGSPNPLITFHPSYLPLRRYPKVRRRQYGALLAPSPDPTADARDPRWTTQRAVGSAAFVARYTPPRSRRRLVPVLPLIQALGA